MIVDGGSATTALDGSKPTRERGIMTFRRNAPAALIAVAIVVIAGSTFLSNRLFSRLTSSVEES